MKGDEFTAEGARRVARDSGLYVHTEPYGRRGYRYDLSEAETNKPIGFRKSGRAIWNMVLAEAKKRGFEPVFYSWGGVQGAKPINATSYKF